MTMQDDGKLIEGKYEKNIMGQGEMENDSVPMQNLLLGFVSRFSAVLEDQIVYMPTNKTKLLCDPGRLLKEQFDVLRIMLNHLLPQSQTG